jgi:hypothetical protein
MSNMEFSQSRLRNPARCRGGLRLSHYGNVAYGPGLGRISAPEVPLDAYVFEAIMMPTL